MNSRPPNPVLGRVHIMSRVRLRSRHLLLDQLWRDRVSRSTIRGHSVWKAVEQRPLRSGDTGIWYAWLGYDMLPVKSWRRSVSGVFLVEWSRRII